MIYINTPEVEVKDTVAVLSSIIEINDDAKRLWYEVPISFEEYLVTENLDSFLVGILFLALKEGQDIELRGSVSARLFYNLNHYVIPALCLANPKLKLVNIIAKLSHYFAGKWLDSFKNINLLIQPF